MNHREQEIKHKIIMQLHKVAPLLKGYQVFLFGSRVEGTAKSRSDFDIGIIGQQPLPLKTFYLIEDLFDEIETLYKIDWVDFNRVSSRFVDQALQHIEVLYEG
jgi:uncharacterized protein